MEYKCDYMLIFVIFISLVICLLVNGKRNLPVGVILDMETTVGKMGSTCISMAIRDFYEKHDNYTTMIQPHFRDSKQDNVQAASAAIDLLKNVQVVAILGPQTSSQADFVIDIGSTFKVPIISPATTPSLSPKDDVYFIRSAHNSSSQLKAIAELINNFSWRQIAFVYEDGEYGRGLDPYLSDAMLDINVRIMYRSIIHPLVSDDWILQELYKLKTMQTRVFVIHALPALASRFFKKVNEAGMMEEGYVWIITEVLMSQLHTLDSTDLDSMQGVLGVKSYIPRSKELIDFEKRWKREFQRRNPQDEVTELDMFGIWGYDFIYGLAMALEKVGIGYTNHTFKQRGQALATDLDAIGTSDLGSRLLPLIRDFRFDGISGDFNVVDGQLQSSVYQIVNIFGTGEKHIGFWTSEFGLLKKLDNQTKGLRAITWPGDTHVLPKGWEMPTSNVNKLRVGVPAKGGPVQFVDANTDPKTGQVIVTGFCVDVFNAVMDALPYAVKREFIPFVTPDGKRLAGSYTDLVRNLSVGKFDAVAGDVTILAKRADYVDFTLPYTEAGITLIVQIKDERKSPWIFLRPLDDKLWITTGWFFLYTGLVIWVLEHHINMEFRGPPGEQIGTTLWFSFSTLVFAHREKLISNLSRFVVIVWVFVVLVLNSSYTASLTSMLTVQQLQPAYTDIYEIMRRGDSVGYQDGSFVVDTLKKMGFEDSRLKNLSFEQYDNALQTGSQNGGVTAIMDEIPYIRVFLAKYCTKYTMTGPIYKTAGFGFAFPKGSPLVHDVSRAVLQVTEDQIANISKQWFGDSDSCDQQNRATLTSDRLSLDSFKGLFFITAVSSTAALFFFFYRFLNQNREIIASQHSITQKIVAIAKTFNEFKDEKSKKTSTEATATQPVSAENFNNSPTVSVHHQEVGSFSPGEETSTTEPGTPIHDTIQEFSTTQPGTPESDTNGIQVVETTT